MAFLSDSPWVKDPQAARRATAVLGVFLVVFFGANAAALVLASLGLPLLLPRELLVFFQQFVQGTATDTVLGGLNWVAFPVVGLGMAVYFWPLRSWLIGLDTSPANFDRARRRILNAPISSSLFGLGAWALSLGLVQAHLQLNYDFPADYRFRAVLIYALWALFGGLISFALSDYANRRWFLPWYFPGGELAEVRPWFHWPVTRRQGILWLGLFVFPTALGLLFLATQPFWDEAAPAIWGAWGLLALVTWSLTSVFGRTLRLSLEELAAGLKRIQANDYAARVPLRSHDELGLLATGVNRLARSLADQEQLSRTLGEAVDPRVRDHLLAHPDDWGGRRVETAVLFCDLRGFTAFSSGRPPEEVTAYLNAFFGAAAPIIEAEGGHINKYLGDALMAVFGTPEPLDNPARAGLAAAAGLLALVANHPQWRIALGLHSGPAVAGPVGSPGRREFTVIGDTVNTASRLQAWAKDQERQLAVSRTLLEAAGMAPAPGGAGPPQVPAALAALAPAARVRLRGLQADLDIWAL